MEETTLYHKLECPNCFYQWLEKIEHERIDEPKIPQICDYCCTHFEMSSRELLLRRIDILEHTKAAHLPSLIKHLIKHIDLKD